MDKSSLRKYYRELRQQIPDAQAMDWSAQMTTYLRRQLRHIGFDGVLYLYFPLRGEPDLLGILNQERLQIAVPKVYGHGVMKFYLWMPGDPLTVGSFGIREPVEDAIEVTPKHGDAAVIPALAVDSGGIRLGYGGGYYDRWLAEHRNNMKFVAAAVFPPCITQDALPVGAFDQKVDFVLASGGSV